MGCDYIATGHYGYVNRHSDGRYYISRGTDELKDQSYVLWGLQQDLLSRTILPLGKYRKPEIRQMAIDYGYPELAKKNESYEICFVPDNDYRGFLDRKVTGLKDRVSGGHFIDKKGAILGKHRGYPFYTIGQRKGLDIAFGKPIYVTHIDPQTNTVTLGDEGDLEKNEMLVSKINWMKYDSVTPGMESTTKIRYKDKGSLSNIYPDGDTIRVRFYENAKSIAPGQSAVFYEGNDIIAGGIIQRGQLI